MKYFRTCISLSIVFVGVISATGALSSVASFSESNYKYTSNLHDNPLPLAGHWNLGEGENGYSPRYQIKLIKEGHYLLPWFLMPNEYAQPEDPRWKNYYEAALKNAAQLKLPISLIGTQWEGKLSIEDKYYNMPPRKNPNVTTVTGEVKHETSPFGPPEVWYEVGEKWTSSPMLKRMQELYPAPPFILFISNNEHTRLPWKKAEEDRRYLERFGGRQSDEFKRKIVADGWINCYQKLLQGMRDGLTNAVWKKRAIFIGYDAFGPSHFARWPGWSEYSLYSKGRISPWPYVWDGASPSFYVFNWSAITDYTVFSPQVEAMNWLFMLEEARSINPNFWFEISTWDGHEPMMENDKRQVYLRSGQKFSPERYKGMVQFGMWLLRPRVVREFRGYLDRLDQMEPYFQPIIDAVDRIHENPILQAFWRKGELVVNRFQSHPYQSFVPEEYQKTARWFLLDTSVDSPRPWQLSTQIPVFAIALVKGKAPQRQWLIYAHSPLQAREKIKIFLPAYQTFIIDVTVAGSFYLVDEKTKTVSAVN